MSRFTKQSSEKAGLSPRETILEVFDYNAEEIEEHKFYENIIEKFELLPPVEEDRVRWINFDGLNNMDIIESICKSYNIHSLVMEDILNTDQRPKIEDYESYIYMVAKMIYFDNSLMVVEQVSIILGKGYVISFGERVGDVFNSIRERLRKSSVHIRKSGADYLAYSILDSIVDGYFGVLERLGDEIDEVEDGLLNNPKMEGLIKMRKLKRDLLFLHKSIWPLREVASGMERNENNLIKRSTIFYIRDVYDHIIQAIDTTETFRELIAGLMDVYLSSISNKMNEIMKVLTIISTIFIPLTFIAGVYGMNFKYMPELQWSFGYFTILLSMVIIAALMILYFKRRKWF